MDTYSCRFILLYTLTVFTNLHAPHHLHTQVRDAQGRKMSKSLGNVVDPVDTIEQYGCDSLRYTLATGTAAGADLNLSLEKVNSSRNFTNKLWNAGKFILGNLATVWLYVCVCHPHTSPMFLHNTCLTHSTTQHTHASTISPHNTSRNPPPQLPEAEWRALCAVSYATPAAMEGLPLVERWILSALHEVWGSLFFFVLMLDYYVCVALSL